MNNGSVEEDIEMGQFILKASSNSPVSGFRSKSSKNGAYGGEYEGGAVTIGTGTKTVSDKHTLQTDEINQSKP